MEEIILETQERVMDKRSTLKQLREGGRIPAVIYGKKDKTAHFSVDAKQFIKIIETKGMNVLFTLKFGGNAKTAIVKEVQKDIISQMPIHVDFKAISLEEKVTVSVPIHVVGIAPGVKLSGGIMDNLVRELSVICLPTKIPKTINVDVSNLQIGDSILIKDIVPVEGIEILGNPNSIVINVVAQKVEEEKPAEEAVAGAATSAEPEVITKGKKEEGEAVAEKGEKGDKKEPSAGPAKK